MNDAVIARDFEIVRHHLSIACGQGPRAGVSYTLTAGPKNPWDQLFAITTFSGFVNENLLPDTTTDPLPIARSSSIHAGNIPMIQRTSRIPHLRAALRVAPHPGAMAARSPTANSRITTGRK